MFKIKFIAKQFAVSLCLSCAMTSMVMANVIDTKNHTTISKDQLVKRIDQLPSEVDLRYTDEVHNIINTYIRKYRPGSERLLGRVERYFPLYESELEKTGMPSELKYLSIVESALRPRAVSHSGAVGLWQFMKSTGRIYGLRINSAVDERRDPIRSTEAAIAYLKDLHIEFGDWTLAMAAYNCGPGNVHKAMRRSNGKEFWEIKNYLPRETRRYIPKYVAISYIMNYSQMHGLHPAFTVEDKRLATVRIFDYEPFRDISMMSGTDRSTVAELNPSYLKDYIPKNSNGYLLTLPEEAMYQYLAQTSATYEIVETAWASIHLKQRLALVKGMKKTAREVRQIEKLPIDQLLRSNLTDGSKLLNSDSGDNTSLNSTSAQSDRIRFKHHKLQAQQSLMDIAELYGTRLDKLLAWNNMNVNDLPPPGSLIQVGLEE